MAMKVEGDMLRRPPSYAQGRPRSRHARERGSVYPSPRSSGGSSAMGSPQAPCCRPLRWALTLGSVGSVGTLPATLGVGAGRGENWSSMSVAACSEPDAGACRPPWPVRTCDSAPLLKTYRPRTAAFGAALGTSSSRSRVFGRSHVASEKLRLSERPPSCCRRSSPSCSWPGRLAFWMAATSRRICIRMSSTSSESSTPAAGRAAPCGRAAAVLALPLAPVALLATAPPSPAPASCGSAPAPCGPP
mmetsp:Transcript_105901/g.309764  ORF Transcript_105901/g.309764 Transcript_105901/m.309764 type:complete len:246 (-) Transcript_105901:116-853(-)